jgi:hypothetical protein
MLRKFTDVWRWTPDTHTTLWQKNGQFFAKVPPKTDKIPQNHHTLAKNSAFFCQSVYRNATYQAQSNIRKPLGFAWEYCFEPLAGAYASAYTTLTI